DGNVLKLGRFLEHVSNRNQSAIAFRNDGSMENIKREFGGKYDGIFREVLDSGFFFEPKRRQPLLDNQAYVAVNISDDQIDMIGHRGGGIQRHAFYEEF